MDDPRPSKYDSLIDQQIQEAYERGEFNNLPGTGKPLRFDEERFVPPDLRLAYKIMKDHEVLPPWIAEGQEIDALLERMQKRLHRAQRSHQQMQQSLGQRRDINSVRRRLDADDEWKMAQAEFLRGIEELNRRILAFNLKVPASHLTRNLLNGAQELARSLA